jgi:hypothetical protein
VFFNVLVCVYVGFLICGRVYVSVFDVGVCMYVFCNMLVLKSAGVYVRVL